ncbi:uncharacterized protein LOC116849458 [Odontomachus brunneus]|uniref:uncharacterized protein LOC116849458 n=1 Tax=Odontomachus brunneus TaxID=486640 RepID=UPI0013F2AE42|nr:uncharacterized protein LOC116849458 [Odontomachus brunneus]
MGEVRLVGFDETVLPEEIIEVLAARGGCGPSEIRLGPIRWGWRGEKSVRARLPLALAAKVAAEERIALRWAGALVEMLAARPLQCHKCWRFGHIWAACSSSTDQSELCYWCGRAGHIARVCTECVACAMFREDGRDSGHRKSAITDPSPRFSQSAGPQFFGGNADEPSRAWCSPCPVKDGLCTSILTGLRRKAQQ